MILEGYSQGATVVVDALRNLTGPAFDAVKGVFLIGDTRHQPGLACNVDMQGGDKTKDTAGLLYEKGNGIPENWVSKSLDVCNVVSAPLLIPIHQENVTNIYIGRLRLRCFLWPWHYHHETTLGLSWRQRPPGHGCQVHPEAPGLDNGHQLDNFLYILWILSLVYTIFMPLPALSLQL